MLANKSLSLYELAHEQQKLLAQLYDPETGEVNEIVEAQLNALSKTTEEKCISVTHWIKGLEAEKAKLDHVKAEIALREEAYEREVSRWQTYLKANMQRAGITEVKCPYFTIKLKKNPYGTEIIDEFQIPSKYMVTKKIERIETKPDKNAIKDYVLETGEQVPGAYVSQKLKLEIKVDKI